MEARGGAALDRDPLITIVGIAAETVAMERNPVTAKRIVGTWLLHSLSGDRMDPDRSVDLFKDAERAGGGLPARHPGGNRKRQVKLTVLQKEQTTTFPQHHDVQTGAITQVGGERCQR